MATAVAPSKITRRSIIGLRTEGNPSVVAQPVVPKTVRDYTKERRTTAEYRRRVRTHCGTTMRKTFRNNRLSFYPHETTDNVVTSVVYLYMYVYIL